MLALANLILVATDGRTYSGNPVLTTGCGPGQPGIELACQVAFEVTPEALPGAVLKVPAVKSLISDDVAIIDLGLTAEPTPVDRLEVHDASERVA